MGGAIKCSLIRAYFLLSAYFLTAQSYKRMRLTTRVYGITVNRQYFASQIFHAINFRIKYFLDK